MKYNFKKGDRIRRISHSVSQFALGEMATVTKDINVNDSSTYIYFIKDNTDKTDCYVSNVELVDKNYKSKKPTHIVVWDEGCGDPAKFFTDEKEAKEFIKELSENSKVIKDSIVFAEVRNVKKVSITKLLKYSEHKI